MFSRILRVATLLCFFALASCQPPAQLNVKDGYVRLSPVDGRPAAGYFRVTGGPDPVELVNLSSRSVERLEMHETIDSDGVSQMRPVLRVAIPAREDVMFEPGGRHAMIWGIDDSALESGSLQFIATFTSGDRIVFNAQILQPGEEPSFSR